MPVHDRVCRGGSRGGGAPRDVVTKGRPVPVLEILYSRGRKHLISFVDCLFVVVFKHGDSGGWTDPSEGPTD